MSAQEKWEKEKRERARENGEIIEEREPLVTYSSSVTRDDRHAWEAMHAWHGSQDYMRLMQEKRDLLIRLRGEGPDGVRDYLRRGKRR